MYRYSRKDGKTLASEHPELLEEWDYDKNIYNPTDYTPSSGQKVWWKCQKGHSYYTNICNRVHNNAGCPYCSGRYAIEGENDLATLYPDITKEWNYEKNDVLPSQIKPMSNKSVWWKCKYGHEWRVAPCNRIGSGGHDCPYCNKAYRISIEETAIYYYVKQVCADAIQTYTDNGFELDIFIPSLMLGIEYDGAFWHKNHENRDILKNDKCKLRNITLFRFREYPLLSLNHLSKDIIVKNDLDEKIHTFIMDVFGKDIDVNINRDRTKFEAVKKSTPSNNIAIKRPDMTIDFDIVKNNGLRPVNVSVRSNRLYWWKCNNGHSYQMTADARSKIKECPYCSGQRGRKIQNIDTGEIFDTQKAAAFSAKGATPSSIYKCCQGRMNKTGGYHWKYIYV